MKSYVKKQNGTIFKNGNSFVTTIPSSMCAFLRIDVNDEVLKILTEDSIIIKKKDNPTPKKSDKKRVEGYTKETFLAKKQTKKSSKTEITHVQESKQDKDNKPIFGLGTDKTEEEKINFNGVISSEEKNTLFRAFEILESEGIKINLGFDIRNKLIFSAQEWEKILEILDSNFDCFSTSMKEELSDWMKA